MEGAAKETTPAKDNILIASMETLLHIPVRSTPENNIAASSIIAKIRNGEMDAIEVNCEIRHIKERIEYVDKKFETLISHLEELVGNDIYSNFTEVEGIAIQAPNMSNARSDEPAEVPQADAMASTCTTSSSSGSAWTSASLKTVYQHPPLMHMIDSGNSSDTQQSTSDSNSTLGLVGGNVLIRAVGATAYQYANALPVRELSYSSLTESSLTTDSGRSCFVNCSSNRDSSLRARSELTASTGTESAEDYGTTGVAYEARVKALEERAAELWTRLNSVSNTIAGAANLGPSLYRRDSIDDSLDHRPTRLRPSRTSGSSGNTSSSLSREAYRSDVTGDSWISSTAADERRPSAGRVQKAAPAAPSTPSPEGLTLSHCLRRIVNGDRSSSESLVPSRDTARPAGPHELRRSLDMLEQLTHLVDLCRPLADL